jgi:hypothetical protein
MAQSHISGTYRIIHFGIALLAAGVPNFIDRS